MKSPFPGMDPYLEKHWRDVHATLIVHARAAIGRQLASDLRARVDERLVVESPWDEPRPISPDVRVVQRGLPNRPVAPDSATAVAEPLVIPAPDDLVPERFIEIIDPAGGGKVISVIEFLSPTNKLPGDGREKYLQKQHELLNAGINLVEVDLTRSGTRNVGYPLGNLPPTVNTTYLACVFRAHPNRQFEIYSFPLQKPLAAIRIPLRPKDADVVLDLQSLVNTAYEEGRYDDINYNAPCVPPLTGEELAWANQLLSTAGKRSA